MKMTLKMWVALVGMALVLFIATLALIVVFITAFVLQIVWFCVPLAAAIPGGIMLGIASIITGQDSFLNEKQQVFVKWFSCWPLLGAINLAGKSIDLLMNALEGIPNIEIVRS